jgi:hypothetical protein
VLGDRSAPPARALAPHPGSRKSHYNLEVPHVIEHATSGRAKCRACNRPIAKDALRFGERQPNAFGDGEMTLWFHLPCAAYTRPEPLLTMIAEPVAAEWPVEELAAAARFGIDHRRVPRIHGAERASTGRLIEKGAWRIPIVFFEEYRFSPGGFVHARCARDYFETAAIIDRLQHFAPSLSPAELAELERALEPTSATDRSS